ncbi:MULTISPECIES: ShlB/FhaC/HecB family hemolysin secretion/activation protein [Proteus]|uniref:ShlB/FhaC/HecB family hemolysin secretion/activation protein n=1 Tax=Proteus TaxID=583 RepID=UPI0013790120|nr:MULTISPECIES: ShlB/FhaC/HecB family hemolysin secretion/activation protein [Proteus]MCX2587786.1 ShlB/FhaC/HecB family hemolysin secretion/activation protein [Proteus penneri]NBL77320.1 ShlB/FhaC/HecB family hemolysin secretion/activation protein [Proteus sp. G2672]NBM10924.1 ShlB/FhaC/HecB family hemolysin secretion/activation protein [Proteus sp. G2670]NBM31605.1 ShlB/FhaC/HecB family hemolysin secretion/activation protein [Proteus sp. G2664]NBM57316.1 ShlB/FhaC/HecB family hemolysin secr
MRIELSILIYCILWCCAFLSVANESHIDLSVPVDLPTETQLRDDLLQQNDSVSLVNLAQQNKMEFVTPSLPCFSIKQVKIHHLEEFSSPSLQRQVAKWQAALIGHCHSQSLLEQDINILNAMLYDAGYVTSEVGNVDLYADDEVLDITLNVGKVQDIVSKTSTDKHYLISQAMPIKKGDILNIKDIEQGAENFKTIPKSNVKIQIEPSSKENESIISLSQVGKRTVAGSVSIDNKEQKIYGDLFGTTRLSFGNLAQLNDTLMVILSSQLDTLKSRGIKKQIFLWQVPYHYWRATLFGYNIGSNRRISETTKKLQKTRQQLLSFEIQRQFRPSTQRTVTLKGGIQYYTYRNEMSGYRLSVHERRSPYVNAGIEQNYRFMRGGYLNTKFNYKQSVFIPGAKLSPIDSLNGVPIFNINLEALIPFKINSQLFFYQPEILFQLTRSDIDGLLDKANIGGLYSVYGFESGKGYSDANQFVSRHKVTWLTPFNNQMLFSAIDYGSVSEERKNVFYNKNKYLIGAATGLEGSFKQLSYQLIWSIPLSAPSSRKATGSQFNFNAQFNF